MRKSSSVADQRAVLADRVEVFAGAADHRVDACAEPALVGELPVEGIGLPVDAGIGDAGQADAGHLLQGFGQRLFALRGRRLRYLVRDQLDGAVDEYTGRVAFSVTLDASAVGVLGIVVDAGQFHGRGVRPGRMAVDAAQQGRSIGDDRIELAGGRKAAEFPGDLVPAAAEHPGRVGMGCGKGLDSCKRIVEGGGSGQVGLQGHRTQAHDVAVCVDQSGQQGAALGVYDRRLVGPLCEVSVAAGGDDLAVVDEQGFEALQLAGAVEGVAIDVIDQQACGADGLGG